MLDTDLFFDTNENFIRLLESYTDEGYNLSTYTYMNFINLHIERINLLLATLSSSV